MSNARRNRSLEASARRGHRFEEIRLTLTAIVTALLVGVSATRADVAIQAVMSGALEGVARDLLLIAALMIGAVFIAWRFGIRGFRERFLLSTANIEPISADNTFAAIVLSLSRVSSKGIEQGENAIRQITSALDEHGHNLEYKKQLLTWLCQVPRPDDTNPLAKHPWQQPLRVLLQNYNSVKIMSFVLTPQVADGEYDSFAQLLQLVAPDEMKIFPDPRSASGSGVEHTEYNMVYDQLRYCCNVALNRADCEVNDLCIDVTGSSKVYTAAATVISLNREAVFSYVVTSGDAFEGRVFSYNVTVV